MLEADTALIVARRLDAFSDVDWEEELPVIERLFALVVVRGRRGGVFVGDVIELF